MEDWDIIVNAPLLNTKIELLEKEWMLFFDNLEFLRVDAGRLGDIWSGAAEEELLKTFGADMEVLYQCGEAIGGLISLSKKIGNAFADCEIKVGRLI